VAAGKARGKGKAGGAKEGIAQADEWFDRIGEASTAEEEAADLAAIRRRLRRSPHMRSARS
jgi:hypothetical protein